MKYAVVLYDGMADYPVPALGGKTPMMLAKNRDLIPSPNAARWGSCAQLPRA